MKEINVLSWGGGVQSTALMLKMLKENKPLDYIIFADTMVEHKLTYKQIYDVQKYIKLKYNREIIITNKTKEIRSNKDIIEMIKNGLKYRNSKYDNLYQSHILYFQGHIKSINIMPVFTRNKITGKVGKTKFKQCTFEYKINQLMRELRIQLGIKKFSKKQHLINMYIGYSYDELARFKPNPKSYATNYAPLIDEYITRGQCKEIVKNELGFIPRSSVCVICFANDFQKVYEIYKTDPNSWTKMIELDEAMKNKPISHPLIDDVFNFRFQADNNIRLKDIDMEEWKIKYDKEKETGQMDIFDFIGEQEYGCNGGCFL